MPLHSALSAASGPILTALLGWAAIADLRDRAIPNRLILTIVLCFVAMAAALPPGAIVAHIACAFSMLAAGFVFFCLGIGGGGDAKLLAAISLWRGFEGLPSFLSATALAGGVLSLVYLLKGAGGGAYSTKAIPYGVAIVAGALLSQQ
jgi:prepilin peptidase CpaA